MPHSEYTFTVLTLTRNRAHTLPRVYGSLQGQTFRDFEWLLVDNESTDGTPDLVENWRMEAPFPIRYIYKTNQGIPASISRGIAEARGRYLVMLDSDDSCTPITLERFLYHWNTIPAERRNTFYSVTALSADQHGNLCGRLFPHDMMESTYLEMRYRYGCKNENFGCQRTDVLRQFSFPGVEESQYVPEGMYWRTISEHYQTYYVNEVLRTYWLHEGQITKSNPAHYASGMIRWYTTMLNQDISWLQYAPKEFLGSAAQYSRYAFHIGSMLKTQMQLVNNNRAKILWAMTLPIGWMLYKHDRRQFQQSQKSIQSYEQHINA